MRSSAGERPPPPIASAPSSSDRRLKGHRDLREAASPQRIRLAPPWESYNRTATGFAPLTELPPNLLIGKRPESGLFRMTIVGIDRIGGFDSAIPRFESWRPSQPVRSRRRCFRMWENRRYFRRLGLFTR